MMTCHEDPVAKESVAGLFKRQLSAGKFDEAKETSELMEQYDVMIVFSELLTKTYQEKGDVEAQKLLEYWRGTPDYSSFCISLGMLKNTFQVKVG
jgi:hypothetical protein